MIEHALLMVISLSFIFACAYIDYEHLIDNDYIESHVSRTFLRGLFISVVAMIEVQFAIGAMAMFAATFDQVLNKLRGKSLLHLGNTSCWDRFFKNKIKFYVATKIVLLVIGFALILLEDFLSTAEDLYVYCIKMLV